MATKREVPIDEEDDDNEGPKKQKHDWKQILNPDVCNGADVKLLHNFLTSKQATGFFSQLQSEISWQQEVIRIMGKTVYPSRETAIYGDPGTRYRYSGVERSANPWIAPLTEIKDKLEETLHQSFNFVLCNYYKDGQSSIGYHSDDEKDLAKDSCIASVSLGPGERDFILKPKRPQGSSTKLFLTNGSLLIMGGSTQTHYAHSVPKRASITQPRINLTFRRVKE